MSDSTIKYVLLTGSDLGNRTKNLRIAHDKINSLIGEVKRSSKVHESEPWGFQSNTKFLNQALLVESNLSPAEVLQFIHSIETEMGRQRFNKEWSSRIIDIDIISAEDLLVHSEELTIPHKHLANREFVLIPVSEITPSWVHPVLKATCSELLSVLKSVSPSVS